MGILSWTKKIKIPKFISGAAIVGLGVAAGSVPALQGLSATMIKTGGAMVIAGLAGKARRIVIAPKGQKLKAATAHERLVINKMKKKS